MSKCADLSPTTKDTMTPIIITVGERTIGIEDQNDLNELLEKTLKVQSLVDQNGVERQKFSFLVDGGTPRVH